MEKKAIGTVPAVGGSARVEKCFRLNGTFEIASWERRELGEDLICLICLICSSLRTSVAAVHIFYILLGYMGLVDGARTCDEIDVFVRSSKNSKH